MLSDSQKAILIAMHKKGLSNVEISKFMAVSTNTVSFWVNRFIANGSTTNIKKSGRKRKTTKEQDKLIIDDIKSNERLALNDITKSNKHDISKSTIYRRLKENDFIYGNYSKKPYLSDKHKLIRLNWAKSHTDYDWSKVIFSDEMSIWKDRDSNKCWYLKGNQKIKEVIRHTIKVHIWGCITLGGIEICHLFEGILNSDRYINFLYEKLIPIYTDAFIFQQDNSSVHKSKKTKLFLKQFNVQLLDFPPNSPDLNPIENLWHLIKHYMSKMKDVTKDNFKDKVKECCNNIDYSSIFNIISSMHVRVQKIIENNGDHINY
jgi:transposase